MIGDTTVIRKWYGTQIMTDVNSARDGALPKIGALGVEIMRNKAPVLTGETKASIMWRTHNRESAIGPPANPMEKIAKPRSRRAVAIGSAMGAGTYTKRGDRVSVITAIEYGTRSTSPTPFIRPSFPSIKNAGKQVFAEDVRPVINKGGI